jgi:bifunctional non-homologous end joining protein LigD
MARLYLAGMGKAYEFCLPTRGTVVPAGPDWLHEIKYDGYRMLVQREGDSRAPPHNERERLG